MPDFSPNRYAEMTYRRCGSSGLKLPLISLGLWQALGEPGQEDECRHSVFTAFDHGITHFDLANNYGPPPGNSERVVGPIFKEMPRDEMIISTKAGFEMWDGPYGDGGSKKYLVASLDQSLQRMGLDYVDIYYHHRPDSETPLEETLAALDLIVQQGKGAVCRRQQLFRRTIRQSRRSGPETRLGASDNPSALLQPAQSGD